VIGLGTWIETASLRVSMIIRFVCLSSLFPLLCVDDLAAQEFHLLLDKGTSAAHEGKYEKAVAVLEDAQHLVHAETKPQDRFDLLNTLGVCYAKLERRSSALDAYRKALAVVGETDDLDQLLANCSQMGALLLRMQQPEEALKYFALHEKIRLAAEKPPSLEVIANQGTAAFMLDRNMDAEDLLRQALGMARGPKHIRKRGVIVSSLAAALLNQDRIAESIKLLKAYQDEISGADDRVRLFLRTRLAYLYARAGMKNNARSELQAIRKEGDSLPLALQVKALETEGVLYALDDDHASAAKSREKAIDALAKIGGSDAADDPLFHQAHGSRYLAIANDWLNAGEIALAMRWLELGRQAEEKRLATSAAASLGNSGLAEQIEKCLALEHRTAKLRLNTRDDTTASAQTVVDLEKRFELAKQQLREESPHYWQALFSNRLNVHPDEMNQISNVLPKGVTLLEPVILDRRLALFVCSSGKPPQCISIPLDGANERLTAKGLLKLVEKGRMFVSRPNMPLSQVIKTFKSLNDHFLAPVKKTLQDHGTKTLLVAPVGRLRYVPFAAMHDGEQYLAQRYSLAMVTGLDLIRIGRNESPLSARPSFVAFANPDGSLPGARDECKAIAKFFPSSDVFKEGDATVERFVSFSGKATFVHLATHGVLNPEEPEKSHLVFANKPLRYGDMMGIPFLKDLRVLTMSACHTAGRVLEDGSEILGDGSEMSGMAYQFIKKSSAGSVLASQWKVDDAATSKLMQEFYANLRLNSIERNALRRAESLSSAQEKMLMDKETRHPFYWAGFVLIGDYR